MSDSLKEHKKRVQDAYEELGDLSDEDLAFRLGMIEAERKKALSRLRQIQEALEGEDLAGKQRQALKEEAQIAYDDMRRLDIRLDIARKKIRRRALGKESNYGRLGRRELLRGIAEEHTDDLKAVVDYMDGLPSDNPNTKPTTKKELFERVFRDDRNHDVRFGNWWRRRELEYPGTVNGLVEACREALKCKEQFSV